MDYELSAEQLSYIKRLARRLVQWRKSASIDVDDLISVASTRWWQFIIRSPKSGFDSSVPLDVIFKQQVKFAMRDLIRASSPVKVTRTQQAKLQAYEHPYTTDIASEFNLMAGDSFAYTNEMLDVLKVLRKLSEREQIILSLFIIEGYSFTEIAYAFDVAISTVTRAYNKAL
jgi:RNA polymerase sigma factor for flagellar operon FliA